MLGSRIAEAQKDKVSYCARSFFLKLGSCNKGSGLLVDYDSTSEALALQIFSLWKQSFCSSSVSVLCEVLEISTLHTAPR
jgi:hypothetical protein